MLLFERRLRCAAWVLVAIALAALAARGKGAVERDRDAVVRPGPGLHALRVARELGRRVPRAGPGERDRVLCAAVDAFRAAWELLPDDAALRAESAFRAGELLRTAREHTTARLEFERAHRAGRTAFRPRAALELGHLHRRTQRWEPALDWYEAVVRDRLATRKQRDTAELWRARVHAEAGRTIEAVRIWSVLLRETPYPTLRADARRLIAAWSADDVPRAARDGVSETSVRHPSQRSYRHESHAVEASETRASIVVRPPRERR
ncbi:MAG: hypothetical protein GY711_33660 [bacterium]|nr:hypothetical protein [bacterium]